ncbi:hypothetical protein MPSEU_000486300 [Mayamaea pseudoterrestris]|nr:hypothetical protein MPSEU_000486300 [Mayamaea pseudoterrestris]
MAFRQQSLSQRSNALVLVRKRSLLVVVLALLSKPSIAGVFGRPFAAAAIFGNLLGSRDETVDQASPSVVIPPPPLPQHTQFSGGHDDGAPPDDVVVTAAANQDDSNSHQQYMMQQQHHSMIYNNPPADGGYSQPPPPPPPLPYDNGVDLYNMQMQQQQREDMHIRQLDVLTERIMELESLAAHDRNLILEWQQNCTSLMSQVSSLQESRKEETQKCLALEEQYTQAIADQERLREELKVAMREAEDLAALIEKHRLSLEDEEESFRKKKTKKKRGLVAWLFGWGGEDEEDLDSVYGEARSTLLKALQTERNSVDELESVVASLQQNNSAIAEQVQSRDTIIDELNDRIAIFEEDKIVLKAALKQLQKEMKQEAPRTQKLADDYRAAKSEIQRLQKEIETLIQIHQREVKTLQKQVIQKEETIREAEGNLTEIGSYVDKLEGRLADFSLARRDIEARERKCREIEEASKKAMEEQERIKAQIAEFEIEREEHKQLLQELVTERTSLKSQTDRSDVEQTAMRLRGSLAKLEIDYKTLDKLNCDLQTRIHELEVQEKAFNDTARDLEEQLRAKEELLETLRAGVEEHVLEKEEIATQLENAEREKLQLLDKVERLTLSAESASKETNNHVADLQTSLHASTMKVQSLKIELSALQNNLGKANEALGRTEQEKKLLEDSLRSYKLSQGPLKVSALQPIVRCTINEYDEFEADPPIHMSTKNLLPNIYGISCRPELLKFAPTANASLHLVVPFVGLDTWTFASKAFTGKQTKRLPGGTARATRQVPTRNGRQPSQSYQPLDRRAQFQTRLSQNGIANRTQSLSVRTANATRPLSASSSKVRFRGIRKLCAKLTGVHGLFTKPSMQQSSHGKTTGMSSAPAPMRVPVGLPASQRYSSVAPLGQASRSASAPLQKGQLPQSTAPETKYALLSAGRQAKFPIQESTSPRLPSAGRTTGSIPRTSAAGVSMLGQHLDLKSSTNLTEEARQVNQAGGAKRSFGGLMQPPPNHEVSNSAITISDTTNDE